MPNAVLYLPWPSNVLSPNARHHWATLSKAKKKAKADAYWIAREAGLDPVNSGRCNVKLTFYPPARYRYDEDGLVSRMKAALDGISAAIGIDDHAFHIEAIQRGPIEKNGMVKVELEFGNDNDVG